MAKVMIGVRVEPTIAERLDRIAAEMARRAAGAAVTRGDASRVAVERGVDVLERELDLATPKEKKPARKPKT